MTQLEIDPAYCDRSSSDSIAKKSSQNFGFKLSFTCSRLPLLHGMYYVACIAFVLASHNFSHRSLELWKTVLKLLRELKLHIATFHMAKFARGLKLQTKPQYPLPFLKNTTLQ